MKFFLLLSRLTWRKPQQDKSLLWNRKSIFILRILYDKCSNSVGGGRERRICRKCGSHRSRGVGLTVHLAPRISRPLPPPLPPPPTCYTQFQNRDRGTDSSLESIPGLHKCLKKGLWAARPPIAGLRAGIFEQSMGAYYTYLYHTARNN